MFLTYSHLFVRYNILYFVSYILLIECYPEWISLNVLILISLICRTIVSLDLGRLIYPYIHTSLSFGLGCLISLDLGWLIHLHMNGTISHVATDLFRYGSCVISCYSGEVYCHTCWSLVEFTISQI